MKHIVNAAGDLCVGTTDKLYQLPDGQWIAAASVYAVVARAGAAEYRPGTYHVYVGATPPLEIDYPTMEAAEVMRDKIATEVNAICRICQIRSSETQQN